MNIQYFLIGILAFLMSCGMLPLPAAHAELLDVPSVVQLEQTAPPLEVVTAPAPVDAVTQILSAVWRILSEFGIPALIATWLLDFLVRIVPPLRPVRDLALMYVRNKLEDKRVDLAEKVVLGAGQNMRSRMEHMPETAVDNLKDERYELAFQTIKGKTQLDDAQVNLILETAISRLKAQGINP